MVQKTPYFTIPDHKRKRILRIVYKAILEDLFLNEKPYLDRHYSLKKLSETTHINVGALSSFINMEYGFNFNDFINKHRIEYFKNLLIQPAFQSWTLEAIAFHSGFKSRTTFVRAFKKCCQCSPKEFKQALALEHLL